MSDFGVYPSIGCSSNAREHCCPLTLAFLEYSRTPHMYMNSNTTRKSMNNRPVKPKQGVRTSVP